MEGDLALKNFKRNRRRYRATVISLVVSIVLFVSASSFTHYMSSGTDSVYGGYTYDVSVYPRYEKDTDRGTPPAGRPAGCRRIRGPARRHRHRPRSPRGAVPPSAAKRRLTEDGDGYYTLEVTVQAFGESAFSAYLKRLGLDPAAYRDPEAPKAVVQDAVQYYHDGKRQIDRLFSKAPSSLEITGRISSGESEEEDAGRPSPSRWTSAPPPTPRPSAATRPRSTTTFSSMCRMSLRPDHSGLGFRRAETSVFHGQRRRLQAVGGDPENPGRQRHPPVQPDRHRRDDRDQPEHAPGGQRLLLRLHRADQLNHHRQRPQHHLHQPSTCAAGSSQCSNRWGSHRGDSTE